MVGLGGLEPPTSPLSGARSSHLSYRPCQASEETTHISFSLRCLSFVCNCVQILKLRWPRFFGHRWRSRAPKPDRVAASSIQIQYCESGGQFGNHCQLYGKRVFRPSEANCGVERRSCGMQVRGGNWSALHSASDSAYGRSARPEPASLCVIGAPAPAQPGHRLFAKKLMDQRNRD